MMMGCSAMELTGSSDRYQERLGEATELDINEQIPRILRRYEYDIRRQENRSRGQYIETYWRERSLFDDERELENVEQVRTRILIDTRESSESLNATFYRVTFRAENEFRKSGEGWRSGSITDDAEDYLDEIASELQTRITQGARRYE